MRICEYACHAQNQEMKPLVDTKILIGIRKKIKMNMSRKQQLINQKGNKQKLSSNTKTCKINK